MRASRSFHAHNALTEASALLDALESLLRAQSDHEINTLRGFDLVQLIGPSITDRVRMALAALNGCT